MDLVDSVLSGDRLALSRLLSQVENDTTEGRLALTRLFPHTGKAHLVGVTGAPGTGKSSLVNQLARIYRNPAGEEPPQRVAVVAVDPTSPFTGGAILGDRIRMRDLAGDPGVFIRSMATRGSLGGLAAATSGLVQVFDAAGFEVILIETVGAGQAEVDIARLAHTTLVVEAPGLGDDIQAIKAGILEIADILVVNKADRPGVEITERALRSMLELAYTPNKASQTGIPADHPNDSADRDAGGAPLVWVPPIQRAVAIEGIGVSELSAAITRHRHFLIQSGEWQRREKRRIQSELDSLLQETLVSRWRASVPEKRYQEVLDGLVKRSISPHQAAKALLNSDHPG